MSFDRAREIAPFTTDLVVAAANNLLTGYKVGQLVSGSDLRTGAPTLEAAETLGVVVPAFIRTGVETQTQLEELAGHFRETDGARWGDPGTHYNDLMIVGTRLGRLTTRIGLTAYYQSRRVA